MGLLSAFSAKISSMRQRSKDKKEFFENLVRAAADGKLTDEEINELAAECKRLDLTEDDMRSVRVQAYEAALRTARADSQISCAEEAELLKLQRFFKIPDADISTSKRELARLRLLTEIQNGNLPTIAVVNVVLQKKETAFWSERASLFEERVVRRRYEGGSRGVSLRIMKGVSYRIGSHRGHIVTDKAMLPVSTGDLIITNKRVIFRGDGKSFSVKLDKLLEVHFYADGVRLTDDKGKPRMLKFMKEGNTDVIGAILSHAVNACEG
jgi:hypothetical protein